VRLSTDQSALYYIYAKSLNILRAETSDTPDAKLKINLSADADFVNVRDIYPMSNTKVLIVVDKGRDLSAKSKESNDDTISQRSSVSAFHKHEPINVANRFFKQVMQIGKIGTISFQTTDLEEEEKTPNEVPLTTD